MGVEVKNLGRLQVKLKKLDPLTHNAVASGVSKAALLVEGAVKLVTPVSTELTRPGGPHGQLRRSISGTSKKTMNGAEATVGTNVEYAMYVEMGTSRQKAQPFLSRGLKSSKSKVQKIVATEIRNSYKGI